MIEYESLTDLCPVCGVHGAQPCVNGAGADVPDHSERPNAGGMGGL